MPSKKNNATVIAFASTKGGNGKTSLSDALANYLVRKKSKVLLIDLNSQMDLSLEFPNISKQQRKQSSIVRAFKHDAKEPEKPFPADFRPINVRKNLDIMCATKNLNQVDKLMELNHASATAPYVLSHVFSSQSGLGLSAKYDYIIIDTHNDTDIPVRNVFAIADFILSPVIPNKFGINSVYATIDMFNKMKHQLRNPITQQSYVTAKLYFVGNLIRSNTKTSNDFMKAVKGNNQFIAFVNYLEIFNKAQTFDTNIFDCAESEMKHGRYNDKRMLDKRIIPQLDKIYQIISK